jgi:hypothetical protein
MGYYFLIWIYAIAVHEIVHSTHCPPLNTDYRLRYDICLPSNMNEVHTWRGMAEFYFLAFKREALKLFIFPTDDAPRGLRTCVRFHHGDEVSWVRTTSVITSSVIDHVTQSWGLTLYKLSLATNYWIVDCFSNKLKTIKSILPIFAKGIGFPFHDGLQSISRKLTTTHPKKEESLVELKNACQHTCHNAPPSEACPTKSGHFVEKGTYKITPKRYL